LLLEKDNLEKIDKVMSIGQFAALRTELRQAGKKVAYCHGVFDLLHPGHIAHLEEAKSIANILVVSVTSAPHVNRGPGRPYFSDELRMKSLAAISCVDYVLLVEEPTAMKMLEVIQPDFYVKGSEYAKAEDDVTGNIDKEVEQVRRYGGDIYFTNGVVFSSTLLLNHNFSVFPPGVKEFAQTFATKYTCEHIKKVIDAMRHLKVMVVGDIIIDEYVFCRVQGLTSKDRAFSVVYDREERYLGGALAIARHIANFSDKVTICSIVGNDQCIHNRILNDLSGSMLLNLHFDKTYQMVVKRRFIERRGIRNDYEKMLSVNYLDKPHEEEIANRQSFYNRLELEIPHYDMVVVADYGHGLLDKTAMEIIQAKAKFLALNCQTNSSNYGTNPITKYRRADTFAVDERELRLALAESREEPDVLLERLKDQLNSQAVWVTLGSMGSLTIDKNNDRVKTPALTLTVLDTVGAGDAFYALASLAAYLEAELPVSSFIGNVAGALAANIMGNSKSVERAAFLKFASTLLKF